MNNKAYYVYKHTTPSGKVYIGITSQKPIYRWKNGNGYETCRAFKKAILKYGWENIEHEILFDNLSKEEAEQKEIELISYYKSNNRKYGYNIENGGHINCVSEETKNKFRGNKFALGHKISKDHHRKMIINSQTKEARKKLSIAKSQKVRCIETNKIYANSLIAQKETNINFSNIRQVCLGKRKTAGGYHWEEVV